MGCVTAAFYHYRYKNTPSSGCGRKRLQMRAIRSLHGIKVTLYEKKVKTICEYGGGIESYCSYSTDSGIPGQVTSPNPY